LSISDRKEWNGLTDFLGIGNISKRYFQAMNQAGKMGSVSRVETSEQLAALIDTFSKNHRCFISVADFRNDHYYDNKRYANLTCTLKLVFIDLDMDDPDDGEALKIMNEKVNDIINDIEKETTYRPYSQFSGRKGNHIILPVNVSLPVLPEPLKKLSEITDQVVKQEQEKILKERKAVKNTWKGFLKSIEKKYFKGTTGISVDTSVADLARIISIPYTVHQATGKMVRPADGSIFNRHDVLEEANWKLITKWGKQFAESEQKKATIVNDKTVGTGRSQTLRAIETIKKKMMKGKDKHGKPRHNMFLGLAYNLRKAGSSEEELIEEVFKINKQIPDPLPPTRYNELFAIVKEAVDNATVIPEPDKDNLLGLDTDELENQPKNKRCATLALAMNNKYSFFCTRDTEELYYYNKEQQLWINKGLQFLKETLHDSWDEIDTRDITEVTSKIKAWNYNDRELLNPDHLIPLKNGVFNRNSWQFEIHDKNNYITTQLSVNYDAEATCPEINTFLQEVIGDEDKVTMLLEFIGFCFVPEYFLEKMMILIGDGQNGKTTTGGLLAKFFGRKNITGKSLSEIFDRNEGKYNRYQIKDKMLNLGAEIEYGHFKNTDNVKKLTGRDPMSCRTLYQEPVDGYNKCKFIFYGNEIPTPKDDDSIAFWRRFLIIDFPFEFVNNPDKKKRNQKKKRDPDELLAAITTEKEFSGLFNIVLEHLKKLRKRKSFWKDKTAEEWKEEAMKYSSPITSFVELVVPERYSITGNEDDHVENMYLDHLKYCEKIKAKKRLKQAEFTKEFKARTGLEKKLKKIAGETKRVWVGIKRKTEFIIMDKDGKTIKVGYYAEKKDN
jgi:P4 family phage/plasmid primase-like protien